MTPKIWGSKLGNFITLTTALPRVIAVNEYRNLVALCVTDLILLSSSAPTADNHIGCRRCIRQHQLVGVFKTRKVEMYLKAAIAAAYMAEAVS